MIKEQEKKKKLKQFSLLIYIIIKKILICKIFLVNKIQIEKL